MSNIPNLSNRCITDPNFISSKVKGLNELVEQCTQELLKGISEEDKKLFYSSYKATIIRECINYLNNMKSNND